MDKELEEIVQRMIDAGESEENIASVIKEYQGTEEKKKPKEKVPKGEQAEVSGESVSTSAEKESSSDSNQPQLPEGTDIQVGEESPSIDLKEPEDKKIDISSAIEDIQRQKSFQDIRNMTPEEAESIGLNYAENYEEFARLNPTLREQLDQVDKNSVEEMGNTSTMLHRDIFKKAEGDKEQIKQKWSDNQDILAKEHYEAVRDYEEVESTEASYKTLREKTTLTEEERAFNKSEALRISKGNLTAWETVKAISLGVIDHIVTGKPLVKSGKFGYSTGKAPLILPESDEHQLNKNLIERRGIDYMKSLPNEKQEELHLYINESPEGSDAKLKGLRAESQKIAKESRFLEGIMVEIQSKPLMKDFYAAANSGEKSVEEFMGSLPKEQQAEVLY